MHLRKREEILKVLCAIMSFRMATIIHCLFKRSDMMAALTVAELQAAFIKAKMSVRDKAKLAGAPLYYSIMEKESEKM
jgi:hypothetical protein